MCLTHASMFDAARFRLLFLASALAFVSTASARDVKRWHPHDFSFTAKTDAANSFMVPFGATAKGPGGVELTVPGFFDGDGTWKVRVAPTVEGAWSKVTKSELTELDGKTAEFTCVRNANPNVHGVLRV